MKRKPAIELAQQQGFTWVPPFDHPMVIAGQAPWRWSCCSRMPTLTVCSSR
jgi:threonine dehydratase